MLNAAVAKYLRTLLILGRTSNLPTVWSNCIAGWYLGAGEDWTRLLVLCVGATCLYLGGMFLNDAFDADFDRQHRSERPIPTGAISVGGVWLWGLGWLAAGALILMQFGRVTAILTLLLLICILIYDAVHKAMAFAPVLMAVCRFLLYLVASSVSEQGVGGLAIWGGFALAAYIIGLSFIARRESTRGAVSGWPAILLLAPIGLAMLVNTGSYLTTALQLSVLLGLWILWCLSHTLWRPNRNVGRTVAGLLAGIVLVDLVAITGAPLWLGMLLLVLFASTLVFQRFIPAT
ncbi:MAG TPA: UbiA family prenyltransferase [Methylomirabilota bacterium]|nr:UbiA family prenyltransferase [Methylomirabilota bacterium]